MKAVNELFSPRLGLPLNGIHDEVSFDSHWIFLMDLQGLDDDLSHFKCSAIIADLDHVTPMWRRPQPDVIWIRIFLKWVNEYLGRIFWEFGHAYIVSRL